MSSVISPRWHFGGGESEGDGQAVVIWEGSTGRLVGEGLLTVGSSCFGGIARND